jgi:DNA-binding transcriptional MerR regulator
MFSIGAVARMTNITEATLRVWERRYKFPQSTRTTGGHRLYSQQEILRLQWVKTRIDEGLQVSHAIRALQRAEQDGVFVPVPGPTTPVAQPIVEDDMSISSLHQRLLSALQKHDIDSASHIIGQAQALFPLEEVVLDLIGPAMHDIGEAWETGKVDVATEHLATNFLRQYLLTWIRVGPPAYGVNPVVLACAPGELHEGSLLMLAVLLRRLRWPVLYLGQTMPLESFDMFLEDLSPPLVVFVAMGEERAGACRVAALAANRCGKRSAADLLWRASVCQRSNVDQQGTRGLPGRYPAGRAANVERHPPPLEPAFILAGAVTHALAAAQVQPHTWMWL